MEEKEVIIKQRFATTEEWEKMFEDYYDIACRSNYYIGVPEKHSEDRIMVGIFTPYKVLLSPENKKDVELFKTLIKNKSEVYDELNRKNKDMITKVYHSVVKKVYDSIVKGTGDVDLIIDFVMNIGVYYELYQTGNDFKTLFARYKDKCGDRVMYVITFNNDTILYENIPFDEFIRDYVNSLLFRHDIAPLG